MDQRAEIMLRPSRQMHALALRLRGTITGEHGIGATG
jgi:hypothetical protein